MVFDRLDEPNEYADVIAALRALGQQSACLLPLATALGPVGLIAFASSREGTYCQCDTSFLRHIGALVAMAIDNDRHLQEAAAVVRKDESLVEFLRRRDRLGLEQQLLRQGKQVDAARIEAALDQSMRRQEYEAALEDEARLRRKEHMAAVAALRALLLLEVGRVEDALDEARDAEALALEYPGPIAARNIARLVRELGGKRKQ